MQDMYVVSLAGTLADCIHSMNPKARCHHAVGRRRYVYVGGHAAAEARGAWSCWAGRLARRECGGASSGRARCRLSK